MNTVVDQFKSYIALPTRRDNQAGWVVSLNINGNWKPIDFNLQEDAWSYFYSKLSELKNRLLNNTQREYNS